MSGFLDELRAEEAEARKRDRKTLFIPGSKFGVRFRPPESREKISPFLAAWRANDLDTATVQQFLIDCHEQVVRRNGSDDGEPVDPDSPLRFDASHPLWEMPESANAHQCVAKLYKLDVHPAAMDGHVQVLVPWLQGLEAEMEMRVREAGKDSAGAESSTPPE